MACPQSPSESFRISNIFPLGMRQENSCSRCIPWEPATIRPLAFSLSLLSDDPVISFDDSENETGSGCASQMELPPPLAGAVDYSDEVVQVGIGSNVMMVSEDNGLSSGQCNIEMSAPCDMEVNHGVTASPHNHHAFQVDEEQAEDQAKIKPVTRNLAAKSFGSLSPIASSPLLSDSVEDVLELYSKGKLSFTSLLAAGRKTAPEDVTPETLVLDEYVSHRQQPRRESLESCESAPMRSRAAETANLKAAVIVSDAGMSGIANSQQGGPEAVPANDFMSERVMTKLPSDQLTSAISASAGPSEAVTLVLSQGNLFSEPNSEDGALIKLKKGDNYGCSSGISSRMIESVIPEPEMAAIATSLASVPMEEEHRNVEDASFEKVEFCRADYPEVEINDTEKNTGSGEVARTASKRAAEDYEAVAVTKKRRRCRLTANFLTVDSKDSNSVAEGAEILEGWLNGEVETGTSAGVLRVDVGLGVMVDEEAEPSHGVRDLQVATEIASVCTKEVSVGEGSGVLMEAGQESHLEPKNWVSEWEMFDCENMPMNVPIGGQDVPQAQSIDGQDLEVHEQNVPEIGARALEGGDPSQNHAVNNTDKPSEPPSRCLGNMSLAAQATHAIEVSLGQQDPQGLGEPLQASSLTTSKGLAPEKPGQNEELRGGSPPLDADPEAAAAMWRHVTGILDSVISSQEEDLHRGYEWTNCFSVPQSHSPHKEPLGIDGSPLFGSLPFLSVLPAKSSLAGAKGEQQKCDSSEGQHCSDEGKTVQKLVCSESENVRNSEGGGKQVNTEEKEGDETGEVSFASIGQPQNEPDNHQHSVSEKQTRPGVAGVVPSPLLGARPRNKAKPAAAAARSEGSAEEDEEMDDASTDLVVGESLEGRIEGEAVSGEDQVVNTLSQLSRKGQANASCAKERRPAGREAKRTQGPSGTPRIPLLRLKLPSGSARIHGGMGGSSRLGTADQRHLSVCQQGSSSCGSAGADNEASPGGRVSIFDWPESEDIISPSSSPECFPPALDFEQGSCPPRPQKTPLKAIQNFGSTQHEGANGATGEAHFGPLPLVGSRHRRKRAPSGDGHFKPQRRLSPIPSPLFPMNNDKSPDSSSSLLPSLSSSPQASTLNLTFVQSPSPPSSPVARSKPPGRAPPQLGGLHAGQDRSQAKQARRPKGILKPPIAKCRRTCECAECRSLKPKAMKAVQHSQEQLKLAEETMAALLHDLKVLREVAEVGLLKETGGGLAGEVGEASRPLDPAQVQSVVSRSQRREEMARRCMLKLTRDSNRFCRVAAPQKKRIVFADEVGGALCQIEEFHSL